MILVTFSTVALGAALTTVAEWRSQDFTHLGAFEAIMLGAFGFALYRGVTLPWLRIVMLFGVLHLALSQVRQADLLGMLELAKAGPILNDYDFGGYLDFVGIAPFIDGRDLR
jgi:hypothetical protein